MSKWRPTKSGCIFVISDIHGQIDELNLILDRILPLRKNANAEDKLIFLGDYIDRGKDSPAVIDKLISLKKEYGDQVVCLLGNHEWMLLSSLGRYPVYDIMLPSSYSMMINNGGDKTFTQYALRKGVNVTNIRELPQERVLSFVDTLHVDFLNRECLPYYELNDYIFVHAGCDPTKELDEQELDTFIWDRSLYNFCMKMVQNNQSLPWSKTVITGHNGQGVFFAPGYLMLDASMKGKLMVVELNSMEAFAAYWDNKKLVKEKIVETIVKPSLIKRRT